MAQTEVEVDPRREVERRGQAIADAMGRYRGTEPLIEAVARLSDDYYKAITSRNEMSFTLIDMANQLDRWALESREGGWSTHQVDPMRKRADELRKIATQK